MKKRFTKKELKRIGKEINCMCAIDSQNVWTFALDTEIIQFRIKHAFVVLGR